MNKEQNDNTRVAEPIIEKRIKNTIKRWFKWNPNDRKWKANNL